MISFEHVMEAMIQPAGRMRLRDAVSMRRFREVAPRYREICNQLLGAREKSDPVAPGYDWSSWTARVRKSFDAGVPAAFLSHPVLRHTMVYAYRRGIRNTAYRTRLVRDVFGDAVAARLLREDAVGRPKITTLRDLTSANRAHHAMHLAEYRRATGRNFWDAAHVVEWGGGYGNMTRLIRRMNPAATCTIVDLPEIGALQYVYLASIEGEDAVHVVDRARPELREGRVNLVSAYDLDAVRDRIRPDAFLSTWALTESPAEVQNDVVRSDFFGAARVLLGSALNPNNAIDDSVSRLGLQRVPIPEAARIGTGNEYWFR
jgi:hypothetical protein